MIHDKKDDPIHEVPDQEPSTSSKYGHKGQLLVIMVISITSFWSDNSAKISELKSKQRNLADQNGKVIKVTNHSER